MVDYVKTDQGFYAFDFSERAIFIITKDGVAEGPLSREGRGPGEHNSFGILAANDRYIYNPDISNARINRYKRDMEPVSAIQQYQPGGRSFDVNNQVLLTGNRSSNGFRPTEPSEGLIAISSVGSLSDTLATIMPRIVPVGYQPQVYNGVEFSVNSNNGIAAAYRPLPWLFLFDESYSHAKTLILEYLVIDQMDTPDMKLFKPKGNKGFGGDTPFSQFKLMDDGDIFVSIEDELIHLSESAGGRYSADIYSLQYPARDDTLWVSNIFPAETEGEFYAANWEYLVKFKLPQ